MNRIIFVPFLIFAWLTSGLLYLFVAERGPFNFLSPSFLLVLIEEIKLFFILIILPLILSRPYGRPFKGRYINRITVARKNPNCAQQCHPELVSGSIEMLKQTCPEEMPKQVRHDTFRVQHDTASERKIETEEFLTNKGKSIFHGLLNFGLFILLFSPLTITGAVLGDTKLTSLIIEHLFLLFVWLIVLLLKQNALRWYYLVIFTLSGALPLFYYLMAELYVRILTGLLYFNPFWLLYKILEVVS